MGDSEQNLPPARHQRSNHHRCSSLVSPSLRRYFHQNQGHTDQQREQVGMSHERQRGRENQCYHGREKGSVILDSSAMSAPTDDGWHGGALPKWMADIDSRAMRSKLPLGWFEKIDERYYSSHTYYYNMYTKSTTSFRRRGSRRPGGGWTASWPGSL